ncbi:hypothetical protein SCA6_002711 [Theobroma cacao]
MEFIASHYHWSQWSPRVWILIARIVSVFGGRRKWSGMDSIHIILRHFLFVLGREEMSKENEKWKDLFCFQAKVSAYSLSTSLDQYSV